jgi:hypothetical protein
VLAALLANLSGGQPPPPAVVAQPFFGGGPFWRRYGYDWDVYGDEEAEESILDSIDGPEAEEIREAVEQAVEAVIERKPDLVIDAPKLYERVVTKLRGQVGDEIRSLWRAEIKRRIKEREEEEMLVCLMSL